LTANTSTEVTGQTHTNCYECGTELDTGNWMSSFKERGQSICKSCYKEKHNTSNNPNRMFVDGKYIPKDHPLWKAGNYKSFDDAAFSSLGNYEKSTKGQVYIITNPIFEGWVKIGMAIDAEDRCKGYQMYDPLKRYKVVYSVDVQDRRKSESISHEHASRIAERSGEWFKMSVGQAKECIQHGL
jgi:hypothetical protein